MKTILMGCLCYLFGRYSYFIFRNAELSRKEAELIQFRDALYKIALELEAKDNSIRKKWQAMVDDFSKYQAAIGNDTTTWTDMDDVYLNSWGSAEK